jgi:thiamine biosynthesis lipoprotein
MSIFESLDLVRGVGRREFLAFGAGTFVVAALPLASRWHRTHGEVVRRTLPTMGTIAEFAVVHPDPREAEWAIDAAVEELRWVERTMTRFDDQSDIGRANLFAARRPVVVTADTALVVLEALRWADATNGMYDPAAGQIVKLWDVNHRHEPPPESSLSVLAGRQLHRQVEVGRHRGEPVLVYHDADVTLDLGAIAKGYAVDRAVDALRARGITQAVVNAGGDLYALGSAPNDAPWQIGVRDPNDTRAVAQILPVSDGAVGTSGTYMQFFRYRGHRYHHLMDPTIAAPRRTTMQSYTVRADRNLHADVAASSLLGTDPTIANALLTRLVPGAFVASAI